MIIEEAILTAIVDSVIGYTLEKMGDGLGKRVREKLGRDPTKEAFKKALNEAFQQLSRQHPQWVANNFDASFFKLEGAPVLAQFLMMDGQPDASELASRWADSLSIKSSERRAYYISELEPIAVDFLEDFTHQLKSKEALRELNISRALDQTAEALQALRLKLGAEKATSGTKRDYLRWLIGRNFYLDPRGTFQTQRQFQVKLNQIFISLQAQPSDTRSALDRQVVEKEHADFVAKPKTTRLHPGMLEDARDEMQVRFEEGFNASGLGEVLELAEVVKRFNRVVILGDPGSGKSTLLRYLALKHAEALRDGQAEAGADLGMAHFPILIRVAEYSEDGIWKREALSQFFAQCCVTHDCPSNGLADLLQSQLEQGNCLILLDGLDEIVNADERLGVVKQIEDFVRRYSSLGNRFVITSRIVGYRGAPINEPFSHYTIREMNEAQIRRFLECWCQAVEDTQTPELPIQERATTARREINGIMQAIKNPGVRRLAVNPLLLRILALIHRTGAKLPQKRIELYKLAADTLARTWNPARGISEEDLVRESALLKEDFLIPLLSMLAYWLHSNRPTGVATEQEVYEVLGEAWAHVNEMRWDSENPNPKITEEIRKFLAAVQEHTGLFVELAPKRYGFVHLTFEEYFVARYLVASSRKRAKFIRQHLHLPRWEEPILLAIGFVGLEYPAEASELLETAILAVGEEARDFGFASHPYEDQLGQEYLFALLCLSDNIPVRPKLLERLIERLADELLYHTGLARFQRYRQTLDERLANLGGSTAAGELLPLLAARLGDTRVDAKVRINASRSLEQLGQASPEVIRVLLKALEDANPGVRANAARCLGTLEQASPEALAVLPTILSDTNYDSGVRTIVAISLGQGGQASPEIVSALLKALKDDDERVRVVAAMSLGRLRQTSPEIVSTLLTALKDADAEVRINAATTLGLLGQFSSEALAALLTALKDADTEVRVNAARCLGQLGKDTPEALAALLIALNDTNEKVRAIAAISLGRLGQASPEIVGAMVQALNDTNEKVRAIATMSLGRLGQASPEIVSALLTVLNTTTNDAEVRANAASSLGRLGQASPEIVSALLVALNDADERGRANAARSLGQSEQASPEVLKALINKLNDADERARNYAATSLGQLGQVSPEALTVLLTILSDSNIDTNVRADVARNLGQLERATSEIIHALLTSLNDTDARMRFNAAISLGRLEHSSPKVLEELCKALGTAEIWSIRYDSAVLLGQIDSGSNMAIDALWNGLLDRDNDVRRACTQALIQLGKRHTGITKHIEELFVQAIQDPKFDMPDRITKRAAYDYAYEGLWSLVLNTQPN